MTVEQQNPSSGRFFACSVRNYTRATSTQETNKGCSLGSGPEDMPTTGAGLDPEVLNIPLNNDATMRLLKARVKALNEQVQLLQANSEGQPSGALPNMTKSIFQTE
jgi:hypothetical protein